MRPTYVTVTGVAVSPPVVVDRYTPVGACALGVKINSGTATYTVEHTFDDVFAAGFSPGTATWFPHSTIANKVNVNADGNYAFNPVACRLNVSVSSGGTVTMIVVQEGLA